MKALLFNIHDVVLLFTVGTYLFLTFIELRNNKYAGPYRLILPGFLIVNAFYSVYLLLFWSEAIRDRAFDALHPLYLPLGVGSFLLGPSLFFSVWLSSEKALKFRPMHLLHLAPALLAVLYLYHFCFRFEVATQYQLLLGAQLYKVQNAYFFQYVTLSKLIPLFYGLLCIFYLRRVTRESKSAHGLCLLAWGFTLFWAWTVLAHVIGEYVSGLSGDALGIAGNYYHLAFVVLLVCHKLSPARAQGASLITSDKGYDNILVGIITKAMTEEKLYLNPALSLERFAEQIEKTPREVSVVINRVFNQNFHEFINGYRVNAAKQQLRDINMKNTPINEIALSSGFNSKATFNRLFKKLELTTPSQYRQKHTQCLL